MLFIDYNILFQRCVEIAVGGCTLGQNTATTSKDKDEDVTTTASPKPTGPDDTQDPNPGSGSAEETDPPVEATTLAPDSDSSEETSKPTDPTTEKAEVTTEKAEATTPGPICPAGVTGNVPNPDSCDAFYICTGGIAMPLHCSEGLEFDPELKVS